MNSNDVAQELAHDPFDDVIKGLDPRERAIIGILSHEDERISLSEIKRDYIGQEMNNIGLNLKLSMLLTRLSGQEVNWNNLIAFKLEKGHLLEPQTAEEVMRLLYETYVHALGRKNPLYISDMTIAAKIRRLKKLKLIRARKLDDKAIGYELRPNITEQMATYKNEIAEDIRNTPFNDFALDKIGFYGLTEKLLTTRIYNLEDANLPTVLPAPIDPSPRASSFGSRNSKRYYQ